MSPCLWRQTSKAKYACMIPALPVSFNWPGKQGDGDIKRREDTRRRNIKPTCTLFVVNFNVEDTRGEGPGEAFWKVWEAGPGTDQTHICLCSVWGGGASWSSHERVPPQQIYGWEWSWVIGLLSMLEFYIHLTTSRSNTNASSEQIGAQSLI